MAERQLKVLIVDDDQLQLELMERSLRIEGFQVATSSSVFGVSNIMRSFEPDVMLIDVHIPALSGDQLLGLARRNAPDTTRFVLYSSCDEWRLKSLAKDTNADGWISKSADAGQVAKKLREVCTQVPMRPDATPLPLKTEPPPNRTEPPPWAEAMHQRLDSHALRADPPPFRTEPVVRQKTDPPLRSGRTEPPPRVKTIPPPTRNTRTEPPPRPASEPPPRNKTEPPPRNKTEPPPG